MSEILEVLGACADQRTENGCCEFNGYLEDYITILEERGGCEKQLDLFKKFMEINESYRIIVGLQLTCNKETIANQIIRYKDAFKLPEGQLKAPYILYTKVNEKVTGILCSFGGKEESIYAKGAYLVLSEPGNQYEAIRNDIVSVAFDDEVLSHQMDLIKRFVTGRDKAGYIQRGLDMIVFKNLDDMINTAIAIAEDQCTNGVEALKDAEDPRSAIYKLIEHWFYLKKFVYVQTMMDKGRLNSIYDGNPKKQRQAAKQNSDAIKYVSYSECWQHTSK